MYNHCIAVYMYMKECNRAYVKGDKIVCEKRVMVSKD